MKVLGIDPGIANTGLAVVSVDKHKYSLWVRTSVKTGSGLSHGERLAQIATALDRLISDYKPDAVAIEAVYHNKNVSSSVSTGKVIGICEFFSYQRGVAETYLLTPQQVKKASGLGADTDKKQLVKVVSAMFGVKIISHHEADAALCALAGCLKQRCATSPD